MTINASKFLISNDYLPLPKREWLDDSSDHKCLKIWDTVRTKLSKPIALNLSVDLPDGTNLMDPINGSWYEMVLKYTYLLRDDEDLNINSASVHTSVVDRLITFLKWLRLNGIYDLKRVNNSLVIKYASEISLGAGYALRFVERLQGFFEKNKDCIPLIKDKYTPNRFFVDVAKICKLTFISYNSLSSYKPASQLMARYSAKGYRAPKLQKVIDGPLPEPKKITRVTFKRYIDALRYLHKWNKELNDNGLSFVPLPNDTFRIGRTNLKEVEHTKNIPPEELMTLLNGCLQWIYEFSPKILDLFDDVESFIIRESERALFLDYFASDEALSEVRNAIQSFLTDKDKEGKYPTGSIKVIGEYLKRGYDVSKSIVNSKLTKHSRSVLITALGVSDDLTDDELIKILRFNLSNMERFKSTWPFTKYDL